jgi:hypothetical protein
VTFSGIIICEAHRRTVFFFFALHLLVSNRAQSRIDVLQIQPSRRMSGTAVKSYRSLRAIDTERIEMVSLLLEQWRTQDYILGGP